MTLAQRAVTPNSHPLWPSDRIYNNTTHNDLQLAAMNEMKRTMKWHEVLTSEELKWSGVPLNCDERNDEATGAAGECGSVAKIR